MKNLVLILALCSPALAQSVVWDNGSITTGTRTASTVNIYPGYTAWSELQYDGFPSFCSGASNVILGYAVGSPFRLADDFTLSANSPVSGVSILLYLTNAGALTPTYLQSATLRIWSGRPGDPGSVVVAGDDTTNRLGSLSPVSVLRIGSTTCPPPGVAPGIARQVFAAELVLNPPVNLPAGTYWFDAQFVRTPSAPSQVWVTPVTTPGSRTIPRTANARQLNDSVWIDLIDEGMPSAAPDVRQEVAFRVLGGQSDPCARADLNQDSIVDFNDYLEFLNLFNTLDVRVDFNSDGVVDFNDYLEFLNLFNSCR